MEIPYAYVYPEQSRRNAVMNKIMADYSFEEALVILAQIDDEPEAPGEENANE